MFIEYQKPPRLTPFKMAIQSLRQLTGIEEQRLKEPEEIAARSFIKEWTSKAFFAEEGDYWDNIARLYDIEMGRLEQECQMTTKVFAEYSQGYQEGNPISCELERLAVSLGRFALSSESLEDFYLFWIQIARMIPCQPGKLNPDLIKAYLQYFYYLETNR
ncbi:hypothetical protein HY333_00325, partial [Candidatus Collierbacteria bacterium]|nr:hypothetical protein [Candidatus Collierbacteria bacterium]